MKGREGKRVVVKHRDRIKENKNTYKKSEEEEEKVTFKKSNMVEKGGGELSLFPLK